MEETTVLQPPCKPGVTPGSTNQSVKTDWVAGLLTAPLQPGDRHHRQEAQHKQPRPLLRCSGGTRVTGIAFLPQRHPRPCVCVCV